MANPEVTIYDVTTGETTTRGMTDGEYQEYLAVQASFATSPNTASSYALINGGKVVAIDSSSTPIDQATYDKVVPTTVGVAVGWSWTQLGGFTNP